MKYHGCEIKKVKDDLGENTERLNCSYEIYKDGKKIQTALTLSNAKEFIDSGFDINVLC